MTVRPKPLLRGPRLRVLGSEPHPELDLVACLGRLMAAAADPDEARRRHIAELYPGVRLVPDAESCIEAADIDALVIATPVCLHFDQARRALENGKHVLVEKPFVISRRRPGDWPRSPPPDDRVLMVGHTFQYSAAVNASARPGALRRAGRAEYIRSLRVNLGLLRTDVNVIWDLAPHDVSILRYVLGADALTVQANAGPGSVGRSRTSQHHPRIRGHADGQRDRVLAGPAEGAPDDLRRQPQDAGLRRHLSQREDPHVRQGHRRSPPLGLVRRLPVLLPVTGTSSPR